MAALSDAVTMVTNSIKLVEKKGGNKCHAEIVAGARKPQSWGCFWEFLDFYGHC